MQRRQHPQQAEMHESSESHESSSHESSRSQDDKLWLRRNEATRTASGSVIHIKHVDVEGSRLDEKMRGLKYAMALCMYPGVPSLLCIKVRHPHWLCYVLVVDWLMCMSVSQADIHAVWLPAWNFVQDSVRCRSQLHPLLMLSVGSLAMLASAACVGVVLNLC